MILVQVSRRDGDRVEVEEVKSKVKKHGKIGKDRPNNHGPVMGGFFFAAQKGGI